MVCHVAMYGCIVQVEEEKRLAIAEAKKRAEEVAEVRRELEQGKRRGRLCGLFFLVSVVLSTVLSLVRLCALQ